MRHHVPGDHSYLDLLFNGSKVVDGIYTMTIWEWEDYRIDST